MIYLDNAATTRPHPRVVEIVHSCLEDFGNPSAAYPPGMTARSYLDNARAQIANAFNIPEAGVVFCGSGTESDNLALKGILQGKRRGRSGLITTRLEHAAVLQTAAWLEQEGYDVKYVRIDQSTGHVDLKHLEALISEKTGLVSIQHVNSETGIRQDLAAVSRVIKAIDPEIRLHSDGVQAFSKFPVDLRSLGVDLYSISGHKCHGIKGAGALIMSRKTDIQPIIHGGGQEFGLRSGTENVAAIAAMGTAAEIAIIEMQQRTEQVEAFRNRFLASLQDRLPDCRILNAPDQVPHIISLSVPGILGEVLLNHLSGEKIYVATGSACHTGAKHLSPVLKETGLDDQRIRETIRISLAACELPADFNGFINGFTRTVQELQKIV